MSIQKRPRKNGTIGWLVRITAEQPDGSVKHETVGTFDTKKEAERAEREALHIRDHGGRVGVDKQTVGQMMDTWLAGHAGSISSQTLVDYEATIRLHIKPALGNVKLTSFTPARARTQYQAWLDEGKSASVVQKSHQRMMQAFGQAVDDRIIPANPLANVKPPRSASRRIVTLDAGEVTRFLQASQESSYHPLWHFLLLEGTRVGEALGIRWSDIHWSDNGATVQILQQVAMDKRNKGRAVILPYTKTATSRRSILLSPQTAAQVRALQSELGSLATGSNLVLATDTGAAINPSNVDRAMRVIQRRAGIEKKIRVHDLRHTCATLLIQAGMPVKAVSERLGHANVRITMDIYAHVMPNMQQDTANAWTGILATPD